jgi:hypothetical protein
VIRNKFYSSLLEIHPDRAEILQKNSLADNFELASVPPLVMSRATWPDSYRMSKNVTWASIVTRLVACFMLGRNFTPYLVMCETRNVITSSQMARLPPFLSINMSS